MIKKAIGFMVGCMLIFGMFNANAQDNKTVDEPKFTKGGFPIILDADKWPSQIIYDTVGACYQGTVRWIVISNPTLIGQTPNFRSRREMLIHCFCVMDRIKKEFKIIRNNVNKL